MQNIKIYKFIYEYIVINATYKSRINLKKKRELVLLNAPVPI